MGLFTLSLLAIGTAIGLVTADARLLVARESYLVLMLVAVVQGGKACGRRHLTRPDAPAPRS